MTLDKNEILQNWLEGRDQSNLMRAWNSMRRLNKRQLLFADPKKKISLALAIQDGWTPVRNRQTKSWSDEAMLVEWAKASASNMIKAFHLYKFDFRLRGGGEIHPVDLPEVEQQLK